MLLGCVTCWWVVTPLKDRCWKHTFSDYSHVFWSVLCAALQLFDYVQVNSAFYSLRASCGNRLSSFKWMKRQNLSPRYDEVVQHIAGIPDLTWNHHFTVIPVFPVGCKFEEVGSATCGRCTYLHAGAHALQRGESLTQVIWCCGNLQMFPKAGNTPTCNVLAWWLTLLNSCGESRQSIHTDFAALLLQLHLPTFFRLLDCSI